jgi:prepilin-type N-terminal cleavage/methylation domain-containing protein
MMNYHDSLPLVGHSRRHERGFTLHEVAVVIIIIALAVAIGAPMMRRSLVRSELLGQVKMLQNAIAVCRMKAIKESEWVVLELLKNESGTVWTAPGGKVFAWVDDYLPSNPAVYHNRTYDEGDEVLVGEWYLNYRTMIIKEGADRRLFDLRSGYKGIVFLPSGVAIATKKTAGGIPGIGRGSVIVQDRFGNQIRLQIWSSTGAVDLTMKVPGTADDWDPNLRHWVY